MTKKLSVSLGYGIILTTAVSIGSRFFGVFINLVVVKLLSPDKLGLFLGVQAMVFAGCGFCDLGLSQAYRQMISRDLSLRKDLLGPTLGLQFVALMLYLAGLIVYMGQHDYLTVGTIFVAIGALISRWPTTLVMDLIIDRKFRSAGVLNFLTVGSVAFGVILALFDPGRFTGLAVGYAIGMIARSIVAVMMVGQEQIQLKFNHNNLVQARQGMPFLASLIITQLGLYFGISYVLATQSAYVAGIVGLPLKIYQIALLLSTSTTSVTLPLFHRLAHHKSGNELGVALAKLIGPLWVIMGCAAGICALVPDMVVALVSSNEYVESVHLLRILSIAILLKSLSIPAGNILESRNLQWVRVAVQAISSLIIILSTIYFYPKFGAITIAYAILAADTCSFVLLWGINAIGIVCVLPWAKHIIGAGSFGVALISGSLSSANGVLNVVVFLVVYLSLVTCFGIWNPRKLFNQLFESN